MGQEKSCLFSFAAIHLYGSKHLFKAFLYQNYSLFHTISVTRQINKKGDFMNDFDAMIEKYSKELVEARRKSMLSEIEQGNAEPVFERAESESNIAFYEEPVMQEDPAQAVEEPANIDSSIPVMAMLSDDDIMPEQESVNENVLAEDQDEPNEKTEDDVPVNDSGKEREQIKEEAPVQINRIRTEKPFPLDSEGKLKVQVFAANQTYPISSAAVTVTETKGDKIFFQGFTDTSGIVDDIILPTVSKEMSGSPSVMKPYEQYDVLIEHPRFVTRKYVGVPIFDGQKSVQTVQLVPTDLLDQKPDVVIESEPNELLLRKEEV